LDDGHGQGLGNAVAGPNEEWIPTGEVDYLEEPIMVRRRR
jgi:hypothetical protein